MTESTADADIGLITPDDRGRFVLTYRRPVSASVFTLVVYIVFATICLICWWQISFHDIQFLQGVQHGKLFVFALGGAVAVPLLPIQILDFIFPLTLVADDAGICRSYLGRTKTIRWADISDIVVERVWDRNNVERVWDRNNKNRYKTTVTGPHDSLNWLSFFDISPPVLGRYLAKRQSEVCPASPCKVTFPKKAAEPALDGGFRTSPASNKRQQFDKKVVLPIFIGLGVICAVILIYVIYFV